EVRDDDTLSGIDFRLPAAPAPLPGPTNMSLPNLVFHRSATNAGGWVKLPDHVFDELDEATIEGWIKCENFNNNYFYSYGNAGTRMLIKNSGENPGVTAAMDYRAVRNLNVARNSILKSNEWWHVAWVTGKGGMRLYVNGLLAATKPEAVSFSAL